VSRFDVRRFERNGGHQEQCSSLAAVSSETHAAGVGVRCACSLAGTRCEAGSSRSDQSEYPSHARPSPTGTAASGANDCGRREPEQAIGDRGSSSSPLQMAARGCWRVRRLIHRARSSPGWLSGTQCTS